MVLICLFCDGNEGGCVVCVVCGLRLSNVPSHFVSIVSEDSSDLVSGTSHQIMHETIWPCGILSCQSTSITSESVPQHSSHEQPPVSASPSTHPCPSSPAPRPPPSPASHSESPMSRRSLPPRVVFNPTTRIHPIPPAWGV